MKHEKYFSPFRISNGFKKGKITLKLVSLTYGIWATFGIYSHSLVMKHNQPGKVTNFYVIFLGSFLHMMQFEQCVN